MNDQWKRLILTCLACVFALASGHLAIADDDSDDDSDSDRHWRRDISYVVGSAYTEMDEPNVSWQFERVYAVVSTFGDVRGHIFVDYHEQYPDGGTFDTTYVIKADCLYILSEDEEEDEEDERKGVAWIGGEVVYVDGPIPEVGWRIVNKVEDNDGGNRNNPDMHGSAWLIPDTCDMRPEPFFYDASLRGKIIVR